MQLVDGTEWMVSREGKNGNQVGQQAAGTVGGPAAVGDRLWEKEAALPGNSSSKTHL